METGMFTDQTQESYGCRPLVFSGKFIASTGAGKTEYRLWLFRVGDKEGIKYLDDYLVERMDFVNVANQKE